MSIDVATKRLSMLQILEPSGGGSGRHFLDLCRTMKQRGHAVTAIYSPVRAEEPFVAELKAIGLDAVHSVAMKRSPGPSDIPAWLKIRRIIAEGGPFDIIHGHSSKAGALARARVPGGATPVVYTPHAFRTMDPTLGGKGRLAFGGIEWLLGSLFSDRIICVSQDEYDHALALGIPRKRLNVVVNGVSPPPAGQRDAIRSRFNVGKDDVLYGFIGRLSAQKAPERLIDAFAQIAARQPNARLLMIGSGEMTDEIKGRIEASGLENRIYLNSTIPGPAAIDAFDVVVMPSRYEAMSYVALEAAAGGKPLLLTDVGGAGTVLDHGVNGLMVPNSDDPTALAEAMAQFGDPQRLAGFTAEAKLRRNRYTLSAMADGTEQVYRDLLGKPLPAPLRTARSALHFKS